MDMLAAFGALPALPVADFHSSLESFLDAARRFFDNLAGIGWGYLLVGAGASGIHPGRRTRRR